MADMQDTDSTGGGAVLFYRVIDLVGTIFLPVEEHPYTVRGGFFLICKNATFRHLG
jgi:hypothetical protein